MELLGAAKLDTATRGGDLDLNAVPAFLFSDFFGLGTLTLLNTVAANIKQEGVLWGYFLFEVILPSSSSLVTVIVSHLVSWVWTNHS